MGVVSDKSRDVKIKNLTSIGTSKVDKETIVRNMKPRGSRLVFNGRTASEIRDGRVSKREMHSHVH
jgi:hypothetical protein